MIKVIGFVRLSGGTKRVYILPLAKLEKPLWSCNLESRSCSECHLFMTYYVCVWHIVRKYSVDPVYSEGGVAMVVIGED